MNAVNRDKTHCDNGHEFTEENTYRRKGWRACKICRRESNRTSMRARRDRAKTPRRPAPLIMGLPLGIWARLEIRDCGYKTPCLVWTGTIASNGYGVVGIGGRQRKLHRLIYEAVNGPMPERDECGKRIVSDHLCRIRACAAPDHVDPVTDGTNVMRGISFAPANAAKTHCISGHEFTPDNTAIDSRGHRSCLECRRANGRKSDARRRARKRTSTPDVPRKPQATRAKSPKVRPPRIARPKVTPKPKPTPKPVKLAPCGTLSAHTRHVRRKEPIDQACRDVHAEHMRQRRADQRAKAA